MLATALSQSFAGENDRLFGKGDMVIDLGVGIGMTKTTSVSIKGEDVEKSDKTKIPFTQKIGFEVGIYNFDDKSSLGFGVNINNSYGASYQTTASGNYDYTYTQTVWKKGNHNFWATSDIKQVHRQGTGSAWSDANIEDLNVMLKLVYHRQFFDKLDTYAAIGFGVSRFTTMYSNQTDVKGFSKGERVADFSNSNTMTVSYKYDDLEHVEWESGNQGRFAVAAYVGSRYYFNKNFALNVELGLTSLSLKKDANNYSLLSVGASYKF